MWLINKERVWQVVLITSTSTAAATYIWKLLRFG